MTKHNSEHLVVLHVTGPDRPGITATLTGILAREGATLLDLGQTVLHEYLTLSAIVEIPPGSDALRKALFSVSEMGLRLEVSTCPGCMEQQEIQKAADAICLTLLGNLESGKAVGATTRYLADRRFNIRDIKTLARGGFQGLELIADLPGGRRFTDEEISEVRGEMLRLAQDLQVDMAVQRDGVFRRNKRLICMDVDSTFVQMEVIDELAEMAGVRDQVAAVTERAMQGEIDFRTALKERVACLAGLSMARARTLLDNPPLTPGADSLVRKLKSLGLRVGLVSGGFTFFVDHLKQRFGLDFVFANTLEVREGVLTGRVIGGVVDAERKAQILEDMAQVYHCRLEQCVAVGDGANDMLMLRTAGLGIAFQAKRRLEEIADLSLKTSPLDSILYLMGFRESDLLSLLDAEDGPVA
jgi:phosphoserine phosphatase